MTFKKKLKQYLEQDKVPHALLFVGPDSEHMLKTAQGFASDVLYHKDPNPVHVDKIKTGNHPDFSVFEPSSKTCVYTIEQIREICSKSQLFPHESPVQFFVLLFAERMQEAAANALLKTLEEPSQSTIFILVVESLDRLLPTITSRTQKIFFSESTKEPEEKKTVQLLKHLLSLWPKLSYNDLHLACQSIQDELDQDAKEKGFNETLALQHESESLLVEIEKWYQGLLNHNQAPLLEKTFSNLLQKSRIGLERSIKPSICIESLLLPLLSH